MTAPTLQDRVMQQIAAVAARSEVPKQFDAGERAELHRRLDNACFCHDAGNLDGARSHLAAVLFPFIERKVFQ